ncbi:MAG TPA: cysteine dioxygenase family protein [Pseudonocardiaceae bacterium]|nr:cysteine dioxygenase family protein [Pseudonocardiaceae bacterium]
MFAVPANTVALPAAAGHPARTAIDVARDRDRWTPLLRYDPDERFAALVAATPEAEVWLLSWLPGQHTDVHDHAGAEGAFTVVSGVLMETVSRVGGSTEHLVAEGSTRVFGPGYVHRVRNLGPDPAVSIHVYRPRRPPM